MARILAVADAYDAMTSARPYRDAMPSSVARMRLDDAAGTQFDPLVVDALSKVLDGQHRQEDAVLSSLRPRVLEPALVA